jgi:uncharacterized protein
MDDGLDANGFLTPERVRGLFDRAVEHFNAHRFFESHEDWERIWNDADGAHRVWLQGLIQVAAGFHHVGHGTSSGFVKLMRSSAEKLRGYSGDIHDIDFAALWTELQPWFAFGERVAAGTPMRSKETPAFPTIRHRPGVTPAPLAPDASGEDEGPRA